MQYTLDLNSAKDETAIAEQVFKLYESGASWEETLKETGLDSETLKCWTIAHHLEWPDETINIQEIIDNEPIYWVRLKGQWMRLDDAAHHYGEDYGVILQRFKAGERGVHLFRSTRRNRNGDFIIPSSVFSVGLSENEWLKIIEQAKTLGMLIVASMYDVPKEAIEAAMNGEMERLD